MPLFVELLLDFVQRGNIPSGVEYIIYLDAYDTCLANDADHVLDAFKSYDCDFLTGNTKADWPRNDKAW